MQGSRWLAVWLLLSLVLVGCGTGLTPVSGTVTLDGKPIQGLEVNFEPVDPDLGTTATGYTQADGSFTLHYPGDKTGAPAGEYVVRIIGGEVEDGEQIRVPAKYNTNSELKVVVGADKGPYKFELTTE